MTRNLTCIIAALLLSLALGLPVQQASHAQVPPPLLVIISNATSIVDISSSTLRSVFEGYPAEYQAGKRLLPLNHPITSTERQRFDSIVLGLTPAEVGRFWVDQRIRGASQPPRTVSSVELAVRVVASLPGAITYVSASQLKAGVKALNIDGKAPSDLNYPLAPH